MLLACLVTSNIFGCKREPIAATQPTSRPDALRIISLSPAISRTLVDLGLASQVVGRSPYCTALDPATPVAGDLQSIDYETIIRLNPTHIFVQPPAEGVDATLARLADERGWTLAAWRLNGLADIRIMLNELPARLDGVPGDSARDQAQRILASLDSALGDSGSDQRVASSIVRVLMLNAVNPPMAFGSGTYLDDILQVIGGINAVDAHGWVQLSLEDVVHMQPEAIILVKPGADESNLERDLGPIATMDVPALRGRRIAVLTNADALLPGSGVAAVASELRAILERFAKIVPASDNRP